MAGFSAHSNDIPVSTKCARILNDRKLSASEEGQSARYLEGAVKITRTSSSC